MLEGAFAAIAPTTGAGVPRKRLTADIIERFDYPANDPRCCDNRYIIELEHRARPA